MATKTKTGKIKQYVEYGEGTAVDYNKIVKKKQTDQNAKTSKKKEIGSFGTTISFVVNSEELLTFSEFTRTVSGRWATHGAIGRRESTEFLGPGLAAVTMTVVLDYGLCGKKPRDIIKKIENVINKGKVEYLVVGGKKVGTKKMRITEMSEAWDTVYSNGALYKATLNLTFEEYVK